jgi:uncharacterized protein YmfQ (DUF2313 family)
VFSKSAMKQLFPLKIEGETDNDFAAEGMSFDAAETDYLVAQKEVIPSTTTTLIDVWEELCGFFFDSDLSYADRRSRVLSKLRERPELRGEYLVECIESYGYEVAVLEELTPMMCGVSECGDDLQSDDAWWSYRIYVENTTDARKAALSSLVDRIKLGYIDVIIAYYEE